MFWVFLTIMGTLDAIGMYCAKRAADEQELWLWALTVLTYALIGGVFVKTLQYEGLTVTNIIWSLVIIIFGSLVGLLIFKEELVPLQWAGMLLAIVAIILIQWPSK